jgi:ribonuclease HII
MICGIDEAGRGPLAGPVCAAAVILPDDFPDGLLNDSKKLTAARREEARRVICAEALAWGVGWAAHTEIDEINILRASLLAMRRAFDAMSGKWPAGKWSSDKMSSDNLPDDKWPARITAEAPFGRPTARPTLPTDLRAVVDGLHTPDIPVPCEALVKADATVREVMAASILAKTARDQLMDYYDGLYPVYGYGRHKGYPTREHRELVLRYGPSPIQRKSFRVH